MTNYHLAQLNVASLVAPPDSPVVAEFMNALDKINSLAETYDGFVWRMTGEGNNATDIKLEEGNELLISNMSVWESIDELYAFTYNSEHVEYFRRRREWFNKWDKPTLTLWWVEAGSVPTLEEGLARADYLHTHGPTPHAFTFKKRFTPEEAAAYVPLGV